MPPAVALAVVVLLCAAGRNGDAPWPHAADRQAVSWIPRSAACGRWRGTF